VALRRLASHRHAEPQVLQYGPNDLGAVVGTVLAELIAVALAVIPTVG
jgi:hypothetical protein